MTLAPSPTEDRVAEAAVVGRIVTELKHAARSGQARTAKVTGLLNAFGASGSPAALGTVLQSLQDAGITIDCGWELEDGRPAVRRDRTLVLSLPSETGGVAAGEDPTIQVSAWAPGRAGHTQSPLSEGLEAGPDEILWFNIDPPVLAPGGGHPERVLEARVTHVFGQLSRTCPGLTEDMLRDLLDQDIQPKIETYGGEDPSIRGVSAVAVIARETEADDEDDGVDEQMIFQMVEMIVGTGWMVSCWHTPRVFGRTGRERVGAPLLREPFISHVAHRWLNSAALEGRSKTSGDLGMYLTRSLVDTYTATHRMMERWVATWESEFYHCLTGENEAGFLKEAAAELSSLLSMTGEFRRRLKAFEHGRETTADKSWFPQLSDYDEAVRPKTERSEQARRLALAVTAACENFLGVDQDIRADMDLLMLHSQAVQQAATERMQSSLSKVTGLVLVPTFIAGFFGANTALPGGGRWMGFDLMLILMVGSAVVAYLAIRRMER